MSRGCLLLTGRALSSSSARQALGSLYKLSSMQDGLPSLGPLAKSCIPLTLSSRSLLWDTFPDSQAGLSVPPGTPQVPCVNPHPSTRHYLVTVHLLACVSHDTQQLE